MQDEKPEDLAIYFEQMRETAIQNGWKKPADGGDRNVMFAWVNYWNQMAEHDKKVAAGDTNPGRPIAPHRSA